MDLYDVTAGYESEGEALGRIEAEVLFVGITSDWLFPPQEVRGVAERAGKAGAEVRYREIDTRSGHDAFLKDWTELREAVAPLVDG
jgi:homoserine O-acetyltransferase/O-succinyltransferase